MVQVWRKLNDYEEVKEAIPGLSQLVLAARQRKFRNSGQEPMKYVIATMPRWTGAGENVTVEGE